MTNTALNAVIGQSITNIILYDIANYRDIICKKIDLHFTNNSLSIIFDTLYPELLWFDTEISNYDIINKVLFNITHSEQFVILDNATTCSIIHDIIYGELVKLMFTDDSEYNIMLYSKIHRDYYSITLSLNNIKCRFMNHNKSSFKLDKFFDYTPHTLPAAALRLHDKNFIDFKNLNYTNIPNNEVSDIIIGEQNIHSFNILPYITLIIRFKNIEKTLCVKYVAFGLTSAAGAAFGLTSAAGAAFGLTSAAGAAKGAHYRFYERESLPFLNIIGKTIIKIVDRGMINAYLRTPDIFTNTWRDYYTTHAAAGSVEAQTKDSLTFCNVLTFYLSDNTSVDLFYYTHFYNVSINIIHDYTFTIESDYIYWRCKIYFSFNKNKEKYINEQLALLECEKKICVEREKLSIFKRYRIKRYCVLFIAIVPLIWSLYNVIEHKFIL